MAASVIDRDERFKNLGLSSLEATTMLAELGRMLGRALAPTLAWEYPTPRALAAHLSEAVDAAATAGRSATHARAGAAGADEPIAIVGLACRFPGAPGPAAYWALLRDGIDAITEVPHDRWDIDALYDPDPAAPGKMSTRWGGFLPRVDEFDPGFFGIAPREAVQVDPQQRLALELSWEALEDAGVAPATIKDTRTGVFFGAMWMDYAHQLDGARDRIAQHTATGQDLSIVSARVSYTLGALGPSLTVNTACSSSIVAVHLACQSLAAGECRLALAGGINLLISPDSTIAMTKFGAMAPDGRSKAFDARANGYVRGEGGGVIALKRLSDAQADGDRVYCVIRGTAINNDGFSNGLTAPSPKAQRAVLADAYARAGVAPREVQYVEAHGTGTMLGDPIEVNALGAVLGAGRAADRALRIGSVKTNFGHLEAAAGMAGIIKVALAMAHRALPPSLHFQTPNPHIAFDALGVTVQTELTPWPAVDGRLVAGVSSFGFGGTNSHAVLEASAADEPRLFVLSASGLDALRARAGEAAGALAAGPGADDVGDAHGLRDACEAAARAPREAVRLAVVARSRDELVRELAGFANGSASRAIMVGRARSAPRVAMLFTGQGAQYTGMGRRLYQTQPAFRAALDRCAAALAADGDAAGMRGLLDVMWAAVDGADAALLHRTGYTQPALFALEYAVAELWRSRGIVPDVVIGHSVGELAAACVAGAMTLGDALRLVAARGRLMEALPDGGVMVAIAADEARVAPYVAAVADRASIATINSRANVVVAGAADAVLAIQAAFEAEGTKTRRLAVSHAFHSPLMAPMRDAFAAVATGLGYATPRVPLISNVAGRRATRLDAAHWVEHVEAPVRFADGLAALASEAPDVLIETGPHSVLVDLAAETGAFEAERIASLERGADDAATFTAALGRLFVAGAPVVLDGAEAPVPRLVVVSGKTAAAVRAACARVAVAGRLDAVAYSLATTRSALEERVALVAASDDELRAGLAAVAAGERPTTAVARARGKLAFVFSGQGSQLAGMGRELAAAWPVFREALDRVLGLFGDPALREVMWAGSDDARLDQTGYTQPALFALEYALAALWRSWGVEPELVAGHSIGELVAACVAGVFTLEDAVTLVRARAALMQALPAGGAMASIGAAEAVVAAELASEAGHAGELSIAAVNGPAQVVIAGPAVAVAAACARWTARGVRVKPLAVSHAFHSALMAPMLDAFRAVAQTIAYRAPVLPLVSNLTGALAGPEVATAEYWVRHVREAVRFSDGVRALRAAGAGTFVEIGARPTLLALVGEAVDDAGGALQLVASLRPGRGETASLLDGLGAYWARGGEVAWAGVFLDGGQRLALPTYAWQRERYWLDASPAAAHGEPTGHPLLGMRLPAAGHTGVYEIMLGLRQQPWLLDHEVAGQVMVPGAAIAELVRAAAVDGAGEPKSVRGLVLQAPLVVTSDVRVQVVLSDGDAAVYSQPATSRAGQPWQLHASATVEAADGEPGPIVDLDAVRARCTEALDVEDGYERFARIGLVYGPSFRAMQRLWRGGDEALAELTGAATAEGYGVAPEVLDAAIQAVIAALGGDDALVLPFEIGALVVHAPGATVSWVHAHALARSDDAPADDNGLAADVVLLDASGMCVAELRGLRLRRAERAAPRATMRAGDGMYRLAWHAQVGATASATARRWLVVGAPTAWRDAVTSALPGSAAATVEALAAASLDGLAGLVVLAERADDEPVPAAGLRIASEGLRVAQALAARPTAVRWVTRDAVAVADGDLRADGGVAAAALWGLARTVMHELPELDGRLIDVEGAAELARELASTDDESQVAWRGGVRHVARLVRATPGAAAAAPVLDGAVLVTGGLGALGLHVARWLAEHGVPHVVLTGRRGLATPGAAEAVAVVEAAGARVTVVALDVTDRAAIAAVLATIPDLRGVIHAAGVLDDGVIGDQDAARLARVIEPKLAGAWHLHELTADAQLACFVMFSSVSGLLGAAGQSNYAAANTALDALAVHRRALGLAGQSLAWGAWSEAGMAARMGSVLEARLLRQGIGAWSASEGVARFAAALERPEAQLGVIKLELGAIARTQGAHVAPVWRALVTQPGASRAVAAPGLALFSGMSAERRADALRALVSAEVARALSLRGAVPAGQPLAELGLDSLMAVELRNALGKRLGMTLPATLAFDHPTVDALAGWLSHTLAPVEARPVVDQVRGDHDDEAIAIVGFGCRYPGGIVDEASYWRVLSQGIDAVGEMPARWDVDGLYDPDPAAVGKMTTRSGGFVADIERFDAGFFGISPREAVAMDPQQRLLLETAWEALEHGGIVPEQLVGSDTGVFVGLMYQEYATLGGAGLAELDGYVVTGGLGSVASGRLSYVLGLKGPSLTVDTACSSSLVTIHLACQALRRGECGVALAGGVALMLTPQVFVEFSRLRGLAADGRCKTFGAGADGVGWAEGCGMLVLKRRSDAERDGDRILALIRGTAVNQDGRSNGLTAPNGPSQQAVIEQALRDAGVRPSDVGYVECHGTGTRLGDPIEVQALGAALAPGRTEPVVIGSVKSNLGHTQAAAGAAGVMKVVLALAHDEIPRSLHAEDPSPHIAWSELPVTVARAPIAWPRGDRPRIAGVSSFGISGTNAHVILEEAPARPAHANGAAHANRAAHANGAAVAHERAELFVVSGKTAAALRGQCARLAAGLPEGELGAIAHSLATTRSALEHRLAVVARTRDELRARLEAAAAGELPAGASQGARAAEGAAKVVFVFPGQGSQWLGMGRRLLAEEPVFRAALEACDRAIGAEAGWSVLAELAAEEASSQLHRIDVVQPTLFAFGVALAALWRSWGIEPDAVVGHSMGEVAAAHVAGILSLGDAVAVICRRSALMRRLSGQGEMAVVELTVADAEAALAGRDDRLSVAVSNSPRSTVISGDPAALAEVLAALEQRGVFCRRVKVDVASHSPQVDALKDELLAALAAVRPQPASVAMLSTVRVARVAGPELDAAYWVDNLRQPVRFAEAIAALLSDGHGAFVELSAHPLLTMAIEENRAVTPRAGVAVGSLRRGQDERGALLESLGALWTTGHRVEWARVNADHTRLALPTYAWQLERYWREVAPAVRVHAHLGHPLLGERRSVSTQPGTQLWESTLDVTRLGWLGDHRVETAVVFPGAGYLEMALACGAEALSAGALEVADVVFGEALAFAGDAGVAVQTVTSDDGPGRAEFQIASRLAETWRTHARGALRTLEGTAAPVALDAIQARVTEHVAGDAAYGALGAMGLDYGPAFRGVVELWRGDGEALGRVRLAQAAGSSSGYRLHPALLDACLHVAMIALADRDETTPWVPVELGALRLRGRPPGELWCHVRVGDGAGGERRTADLALIADDGAVIVELTGLVVQRLATRAVHRAEDDWFVELGWERAAVPAAVASPGRWFVLGGGALGAALGEQLAARGHRAVHVAELGGAPTQSLVARAIARAFDGAAPTAIVHLGSLDRGERPELAVGTRRVSGSDASDGEAIDVALVDGCDSVLATVQAIAAAGWRDAPRLWLVTRGAQSVDGGDAAIAHAPVLGLGRVIALEHAELRCARIDLDPARPEAEVAALAAELLGDDGEDEIALRGDARHVARLASRVPEVGASERSEPAGGRPYRVEIDEPGVLDRLALRVVERRQPGQGEVEIAVAAAGVNFRDVLLALGVLPNDVPGADALRLGNECAGVVTAVGDGVIGLAVGERVVAASALGAFASHVTLPAALVLPVPAGLSLTEAAALPVAYLTAWYALAKVGQLRRGERVLIHAATGGVGLAAVQWAQHVGAEVYATAGTPEKRAYLASLGVRHVSDSRSDRFVADVRAWTGGEGVDVVLNSLSGDLIGKSFGLLRSFGRFLEIGRRDYYTERQLALRPFLRSLTFSFVDLRGMIIERPAWVRALFEELLEHVAAGALSPPPITARPIGEIAELFRTMASGKHLGKLVLTFGEPEPMVKLSGRRTIPIRGDGSYVITGGLGGLGLGVAGWLAERGAGRVVLVGRSGATSDAQRAAIAAIAARGTRVTVVRADVAQRAEVARVIAEAGPELRGVVHAAGLLDDGLVLQQTPAKLRAVMAPKLFGALHLHELTRGLPLELFVMYGSAAGVLGSPGQANYAAANTFLDALAHHRRALGLPGLTIDWGAFSEVGLAAAMDNRAARLEARGMRSLTPADGLRALERLVASDRTQTGVIPLDPRQWIEFYPAAASSRMLAPLVAAQRSAAPSGGDRELRARLAATSPGERAALIEDIVRSQIGRVLRIELAQLDNDTPLTALGMDSLTGLELRNRIEGALGITVPATLLWMYPTVTALSAHLAASALAGEPATAERVADEVAPASDTAPLSDAVAGMDDDNLLSFIDGLIDRAHHSEPTQ